jgi:hypothetical protein
MEIREEMYLRVLKNDRTFSTFSTEFLKQITTVMTEMVYTNKDYIYKTGGMDEKAKKKIYFISKGAINVVWQD